MAELLKKMRVFCSDIVGVHAGQQDWQTIQQKLAGTRRQECNPELALCDGVMQKDPYLKNLFKLGIKSLRKNADDEIIEKLHDELLLKVFHAQIANDVKDYKDSKTNKMSNNDASNVSFCTSLKCASKKVKHEMNSICK